ncbi:MAG TPA: acylphosphatase [Gammaproteobacteria bacterium]
MSEQAGSDRRAVRYVVAGRVQGVYYRASTARRAQELGVHGWARNLPDGTVEVVAAADADTLSALAEWLWEGPPAARVESVTLEEWTDAVPDGFHIR